MIFVRPRILVKLTIFFVMLGFLLFFVVYGYRYDTVSMEFVPHTASYHVATRDEDQSITFDTYIQKNTDKTIDIYNIKPGCYTITKGEKNQVRCFKDYDYILDTYVHVTSEQSYNGEDCEPLSTDTIYGSQRCIGETCFDSDLISAFQVDTLSFVQTKRKIYTCNVLWEECRLLTSTIEPILCVSDIGLHSKNTTFVLK